MPDAPVPDRPRTALFCTVLVAGPLFEVVEAALSPLTNGTTEQDLAAIAASPGRFSLSVAIGLVGTFLLLPGLLGLAHRTTGRSPRLGLVAAVAVGLLATTFVAIRMGQAAQLALATHLPIAQAATLFDAMTGNPIGLPIGITFLATNLLGIVLLGIALLRSRRVPIGSVVLLFLFPVADWLAPNELGVVFSHLVLTAAFAWMALGFLRSAPVRRPLRSELPQEAVAA